MSNVYFFSILLRRSFSFHHFRTNSTDILSATKKKNHNKSASLPHRQTDQPSILHSIPSIDEVAALVLSVGHTWTQAGYAGEDTPKSIFPTSVGWVDLPAEADQGDDADNSEDTQMQDVTQNGASVSDSNHIGKKDADGGDVAPQPVGAGVVPSKKITKRGKYYVGDGEISCWRPDMEIKSPMKDGLGKAFASLFSISSTAVQSVSWLQLLTIIFNSFHNGKIVEDWDALEQIWDHAFLKRLRCDPTEHPLIITESAWNTREIREKLTELAFEKYNFPAFFVAKDAVMTA